MSWPADVYHTSPQDSKISLHSTRRDIYLVKELALGLALQMKLDRAKGKFAPVLECAHLAEALQL